LIGHGEAFLGKAEGLLKTFAPTLRTSPNIRSSFSRSLAESSLGDNNETKINEMLVQQSDTLLV
jgi:hypothetical protein